MNLKELIRFAVLGLAAGILASCSGPVSPNYGAAPPAPIIDQSETLTTGTRAAAAAPEVKVRRAERPGLATGWGREVGSAMSYTDFQRSASKPRYVAMIRYNDSEGAKEMGVDRKTRGSGMQKAAGGLVEWGMASGWSMLDNHWWRGERFVIGSQGREYELRVKNISDARLELVMSVDGLDVIDGESASVKKRGYIIAPGKALTIKGFRTSQEKVATFKFSSVANSYANLRHGKTRNVGVVGLALFTEKGHEPGHDQQVRAGAQPFAEAPVIRARD